MASTVEIHVKANTKDAERELGGLAGVLGRIGEVGAGILSANTLQRLAGGVADLVKGFAGASVNAVADYQAMEMGLEGLLARELARGTLVTKTSRVAVEASSKEGKAAAAAAKKLADLRWKYDDLQDSIAVVNQRMGEWTDKTKESTKMGQRDQLEDYNHKLAETAKAIADLEKAGAGAPGGTTYKTVTEQVYEGAKKISDVMPQAQQRAKDLMEELAVMAIKSPFQVENVQNAFRLASVYGYTAKEAKSLTGGILDMAAGMRLDNTQLDRMSYNLLQLSKLDKVTMRDQRELGMVGLDLVDVFRGVSKIYGLNINSIDEWNQAIDTGKITWSQFAVGFEKYADEQFGGSSERASRSIRGLQSTMADVFTLTMPKVLGGAADEITERLSKILDKFLEIRDSPVLAEIGGKLASKVDEWLGPLDRFLGWFDTYDQTMSNIHNQDAPFLLQDVALRNMDEMTAKGGPFQSAMLTAFGPETTKTINDVGNAIKWVMDQVARFTGEVKPMVDAIKGVLEKGLNAETFEALWGGPKGEGASIFNFGKKLVDGLAGDLATVKDIFTKPLSDAEAEIAQRQDPLGKAVSAPFKGGFAEIGKAQVTMRGELGAHGRKAQATIQGQEPRIRAALVQPFRQAAKNEVPEQLQIITAEVEKTKLPPLFIRIGWQVDPMPKLPVTPSTTPDDTPHWQDIVRAGLGASFTATRPRLMMVGERGAEQVNVQPLGRTTLQPAGAGAGAPVQIIMHNTVRSDADIDAIAYRVAQALRRRNR